MSAVQGEVGLLNELVVCSLEPWDDVWRRNQFFTEILLRRNPRLRVLFVEPAADVVHDVRLRRLPTPPSLRSVFPNGRLRAFRPVKLLPLRFHLSGVLLQRQVVLAARALRLSDPILWINDVTYAPLIRSTKWPSLYDITDDWLLAPASSKELDRLRKLDEMALVRAGAVVVCSQALARSRGTKRTVSIVPNGVDVEHFRRLQPRPADLPEGPVAVYVGSLHDARIDVGLVVDLANSLPQLTVALIGPDSLGNTSQFSSHRNDECPHARRSPVPQRSGLSPARRRHHRPTWSRHSPRVLIQLRRTSV